MALPDVTSLFGFLAGLPSDLVDALTDTAQQPAGWALLILLALCVVDGFFPPVPSESIVIGLSVVAAASGEPSLWAIWAVAAVGAITGDTIAYSIGRRAGPAVLRRGNRDRRIAAFDRAERMLAERGAVVLLTARHVPVARVAVTMTAGATRMPAPRFAVITLVNGSLWAAWGVSIGTLAGYWLGDRPLLAIAVGIGVALSVGLLVDAGLRRARQRTAAPAPTPLPSCRTDLPHSRPPDHPQSRAPSRQRPARPGGGGPLP